MQYPLDDQAVSQVFELGAPIVLEAKGEYKLEMVYNLDRGQLAAVSGMVWGEGISCQRNAAKTSIHGCGTSNVNVLSLGDSGTGLETKTPSFIPVMHASADPVT